jgi:hypothetical protein
MRRLSPATWPKPLLSALSQGLISGVSFCSALALLHYGQGDDYSVYVLCINAYLLLSSVLNALLLQPLATLSCRMPAVAVRRALQFGMLCSLLLALSGALGLGLYRLISEAHATPVQAWGVLALSYALLLLRDLRRAAWLLDSQMCSLLKFDALYCALALLLLAWALWLGQLALGAVLLAISLPALPMILRGGRWTALRAGQNPSVGAAPRWREIWQCARWALPGVLVTWVWGSGYWFYLDSTQGKAAVALLAASRLLFTPIGLINTGWGSYARPVFARLEHAGAHERKQLLVRRYSGGAGMLVLLYTLLLSLTLACWPQWMPARLGRAPMQTLIWAWGMYYLAQWLRGVRLTSILASAAGFRTAFHASLLACALFYVLFLPLSLTLHDPVVCPLALMISEIGIYVYLLLKTPPMPVRVG